MTKVETLWLTARSIQEGHVLPGYVNLLIGIAEFKFLNFTRFCKGFVCGLLVWLGFQWDHRVPALTTGSRFQSPSTLTGDLTLKHARIHAHVRVLFDQMKLLSLNVFRRWDYKRFKVPQSRKNCTFVSDVCASLTFSQITYHRLSYMCKKKTKKKKNKSSFPGKKRKRRRKIISYNRSNSHHRVGFANETVLTACLWGSMMYLWFYLFIFLICSIQFFGKKEKKHIVLD